MEHIAQFHKRTVGGIYSRRREIAYKLHEKGAEMEEIMEKTKLSKDTIAETIEVKLSQIKNRGKKQLHIDDAKIQTPQKATTTSQQFKMLRTEINEMKNEIQELTKVVKELHTMINAIYEFENA